MTQHEVFSVSIRDEELLALCEPLRRTGQFSRIVRDALIAYFAGNSVTNQDLMKELVALRKAVTDRPVGAPAVPVEPVSELVRERAQDAPGADEAVNAFDAY